FQRGAQQLRSRGQIPLRVGNVGVPQIRGKLWQMPLHIDPPAIPGDQRPYSQPVTQSMQNRSVRVTWRAQADLVREFHERPSQHVIRHSGSAVGEKEVGTGGGWAQASSQAGGSRRSTFSGSRSGSVTGLAA